MLNNKCLFTGTIFDIKPLSMTSNNKEMVSFCVSVKVGKDADGKGIYEYIPCKAYERNATLMNQYFVKDKPIQIETHAHRYRFTDQGGIERTVTEFIVDQIGFVPSERQPVVPAEEPAAKPVVQPNYNSTEYGYSISVSSDDLPF